jgi:membrane protein implicated in regulation of membrane protease activity
MTNQQAFSGAGFVNVVRAGLAAVIAIAFIGLVFFLAAFLTMAALVAAGVAALGASAWWLYRKVRGRTTRRKSSVLVARRGPHGWTVDGDAGDAS